MAKITFKTHMQLKSMMKEWYGEELAEGAVIQHLPQPVSIEDEIDKIVRRKIAAGRLKIAEIQSKWVDMVGEETARRAQPVRLKEGVLEIEVRHPAYLRTLDVPVIRDMILQRTQEITGKTYCREVRFCPLGSVWRS